MPRRQAPERRQDQQIQRRSRQEPNKAKEIRKEIPQETK